MVEGILCVDKPSGLTSHDVVSRVRRLANTRKVGHGGTLDPMATGLLVVAIGRATRLLEYVLGQPKEYVALIRLGQTSNTFDAEGELVESGVVDVAEAQLVGALGRFRGEIWQTPPMYSAIKQSGKPLYELARQGIAVERQARRVTVYELELLSYQEPDIQLRIKCSSGTYIRALAHDLGQVLGCGAYLAGLRRTAVGSYKIDGAAVLQTLTSEQLPAYMSDMDSAVDHLQHLVLEQEQAHHLSQGKWIDREETHPGPALVRVYDQLGRFVGIASSEGQKWRPEKIFYNPSDPASDG